MPQEPSQAKIKEELAILKEELAILYLSNLFRCSKQGASQMLGQLADRKPELMKVKLPSSTRALTTEEKNVQHLVQRRVVREAYRARCITIDLLNRAVNS